MPMISEQEAYRICAKLLEEHFHRPCHPNCSCSDPASREHMKVSRQKHLKEASK